MDIGVSIFPTDYSIRIDELAKGVHFDVSSTA